MIYRDIDQGSDEWKALRVGRVTGSRGAATVLFGAEKSREALINVLLDEEILGVALKSSVDEYKPYAMERGTALEDDAAAALSFETNLALEKIAFATHPLRAWMGVSPDRVVLHDNAIVEAVEIKCPMPHVALEYAQTNSIPKQYIGQVEWYFVTIPTLEKLHFTVYCPEITPNPLYVVTLERSSRPLELYEKNIASFVAAWSAKKQQIEILKSR